MRVLDTIINHFYAAPGAEVRVLFGALTPLGLYVAWKAVRRLIAATQALIEVPQDHPFRPVTEAWQALFAITLLTVVLLLLAIGLLQVGVNNPAMWAIVDGAILISLLMPCNLYAVYEKCRRSVVQNGGGNP